jgi:hypothetical protein
MSAKQRRARLPLGIAYPRPPLLEIDVRRALNEKYRQRGRSLHDEADPVVVWFHAKRWIKNPKNPQRSIDRHISEYLIDSMSFHPEDGGVATAWPAVDTIKAETGYSVRGIEQALPRICAEVARERRDGTVTPATSPRDAVLYRAVHGDGRTPSLYVLLSAPWWVNLTGEDEGRTPFAPATRTAEAARRTWLTPFGEAWQQRFGEEPPDGEIGNFLKPLRENHDDSEILRRWRAFLADSKLPQYARPVRFVQGFGEWAQQRDAESSHARDTYDDSGTQKRLRAELEDAAADLERNGFTFSASSMDNVGKDAA